MRELIVKYALSGSSVLAVNCLEALGSHRGRRP